MADSKLGGYICCLENWCEVGSNLEGRNFLDKLQDSFWSVEERSVSLIFDFLEIGPGLLLVSQDWFWNSFRERTTVELICLIVRMRKEQALNLTLMWSCMQLWILLSHFTPGYGKGAGWRSRNCMRIAKQWR